MRKVLNDYITLFRSTTLVKWASVVVLGGAMAVLTLPAPVLAGTAVVTGGMARGQGGDGTMSPAALAAMTRGPLSASAADAAIKADANAASDAALGRHGADSSTGAVAEGEEGAPNAPVVASEFAGQFDPSVAPADTFGATGTTRYIQVINRKVGIYSRTSAVPISSATLNALAGFAGTVSSFDPQVIWDPTTNRFYYAMDSVFSSTDNRIAFGFSKSSSPNTSADFCKYFVNYGAKFPDYPKLGDNQYWILIGVNNFQPSFVGSDILALTKPIGTGTITTCPSFTALMNGRGLIFQNIRDTANQLVFTPTPANSIDTDTFGYVIARNLSLPSTHLWIAPVSGGATGLPVLSPRRVVTVPTYTAPPDATQPTFTQRLDTLDARPWQAILSRNPLRANGRSLWTQHTVAFGTVSKIAYYEIKPDVAAPVVLRTGTIQGTATTFFFNGALSSDRIVGNAATGGSFVIGYNVSSPTLPARIVAGSSVNGAALTFVLIQAGAGPYRDFTCPNAGQTCRWGDYAAATPDPAPQGGAPSAVGLTHQYSPGGAMPTTQANWLTWIYHVRP